MKKASIFIGLILALGFLNSCDHDTIKASGDVTSLDYAIPSFSKIIVSDAFNVYVSFSETEESVRIEANENLHDEIVVKREGDALIIRLKKFTSIRGNATMNAYIVTKDVATFDLRGASSLNLENEWIVSDGRIDLSGSSDFTGEVNAERLYLDSTGSSSYDLFGSAVFVTAKLKGSSDMRDYDLSVENLKIELSGSSDAYLKVNETIDVRASGASTLNYKGNATINNQKLTGSSEIRNRN